MAKSEFSTRQYGTIIEGARTAAINSLTATSPSRGRATDRHKIFRALESKCHMSLKDPAAETFTVPQRAVAYGQTVSTGLALLPLNLELFCPPLSTTTASPRKVLHCASAFPNVTTTVISS